MKMFYVTIRWRIITEDTSWRILGHSYLHRETCDATIDVFIRTSKENAWFRNRPKLYARPIFKPKPKFLKIFFRLMKP